MIGITGLARSGKNTLADSLKDIIKDEWGCKVKIISLADQIKKDLKYLIRKKFNMSSYSEDTKEKNIIRPILVAYGESMKKYYGEDIWMKILLEKYDKSCFNICCDVRFDFEAKRLQKDFFSEIVHITRNGNEQPINEFEKLNDPKVREISDINYTWETFGVKNIKQSVDHAEVIWNLIPQEKKDKWKKILSS
jgi:hypothetical protein